jgi:hypothetical protein
VLGPPGRFTEVGEQLADPGVDLVADRAYVVDVLACGVGQLPVEVALAGEDGARVATAMVMTTSDASTASAVSNFGTPFYTGPGWSRGRWWRRCRSGLPADGQVAGGRRTQIL